MRSKQEAACQRERLLSFESVKRWMERETIKSTKTRIGYLDHLQVLLDRLGCNPDELVAQRIEDVGQQEFTKRERLEQRIFWQVTFTDQFIDNTEDSLVLLNALGQHVDETPNLADTKDDENSWQRYPDGSDNWVYAPSTRGVTDVPECPSPAVLAVAIIAATLLLLRRKRNVT